MQSPSRLSSLRRGPEHQSESLSKPWSSGGGTAPVLGQLCVLYRLDKVAGSEQVHTDTQKY